ncbi:Hypothetical protein A7982_07323 [Minicystis rosea]|nr:Hypothetical protein A7982_07323 [Minicystis rosea]
MVRCPGAALPRAGLPRALAHRPARAPTPRVTLPMPPRRHDAPRLARAPRPCLFDPRPQPR